MCQGSQQLRPKATDATQAVALQVSESKMSVTAQWQAHDLEAWNVVFDQQQVGQASCIYPCDRRLFHPFDSTHSLHRNQTPLAHDTCHASATMHTRAL